MEVNLKKLEHVLSTAEVVYLSTSKNDRVSSRPLGSVSHEKNAEIKAAYILRYPDAFSGEDEFISSDEVFFEISMEHVCEWIYEDEIPVGLAEQQM